jgi:hypothetical protein
LGRYCIRSPGKWRTDLTRKGVEEEELRLPDSEYFGGTSPNSSVVHPSLSDRIAKSCPLPREQMWQSSDTEELSDAIPRYVSPLGNWKVFMFHTKKQKREKMGHILMAIMSMIVVIFLAFVTRLGNVLLVPFVPCLILLFYRLYRWHWCKRSQIEMDEMSIALLGPRGVVWNVPWFTVESFEVGNFNAKLKTKNGKTHKIPLGTARWEELMREIDGRLPSKKTTEQPKDETNYLTFTPKQKP